MSTPSSARVLVSPSWNRPPIAQPAAAPAPTSSVPTRMATLSSVIVLVQLIGAASAKARSPSDAHEAVADIPTRPAAQASPAGGGFPALSGRLVGFHVKSGGAQQRMGVRLRSAAQEIAENLVAFDRLAAFDIAEHRSLQGRTRGGWRHSPPFKGRFGEREGVEGQR